MNALQSVLGSIDRSVLEWLHHHATPGGVDFALAVSHFGSPFTLTCLALIGAAFLAPRREWILLGGWSGAFLGEFALDEWLKAIIRRPRPVYATTFMHHPTWSFPSGHAMGSLVAYGMLAYVLFELGPRSLRFRLMAVAASAALIAIIGISRLYLGVHYLSDVVGGYAVGLVWLSLCIWGVEVARRWSRATPKLHPTG